MKLTMKAARVNAGLSQKMAAISLGISVRTLCSYENSITTPNALIVEKMRKLYAIDSQEICATFPHITQNNRLED